MFQWCCIHSNLDDESCNPPAAKRQALSTSEYGEAANFVGSRFLSADCKYNLLVYHSKPGADYSFTKSTSKACVSVVMARTVSLACIQ